ncbi:MAG: RNA methyltransferase [Defluviitaleaceae bacterium]|nr:RNA methyltransferase [Defluviitaleaceae bacterium]
MCAESWGKKSFDFRAPILTVSDSRFLSLSDTTTPQGIMAVCEKHTFTFDHLLKENSFLLIGECLSDPGNIGTLIRTAAAAGASGVVLSAGSGDIYNPKTIRAAAGAVLHIPVVEDADLPKVISFLKHQNILIIATHLCGSVLPYELDLCQSCAILIGNEAHGLSDSISNLADICVKLPMHSNIESLNASVAGGILLYEVVRQRFTKKR